MCTSTRRINQCVFSCFAGLLTCLCFTPISLNADGTETLGDPSIAISSGSGAIVKGTGMLVQPGTISFNVPISAVVSQVLLHWQGFNSNGVTPADDQVLVERVGGGPAVSVTGSLIGGGNAVFGSVRTYTLRADITALGLVSPGANLLRISEMNFTNANNGAGVIVIYDDGSGVAPLLLKDGSDFAFKNFVEPLRSTVPQIFSFVPASIPRSANLSMFFSSIAGPASGGGALRPNSIEVTIEGVTSTYSNLLGSYDGDEWDSVEIPVTIPAGASSVAVQAFSRDDFRCELLPASLVWNAAGLHVPNMAPVCNAGGPYNSPCSSAVTDITLNGFGSSDPEVAGLSYAWTTDCAQATLQGEHQANPVLSLTLPGTGVPQSCSVTLTVSDGINTRVCSAQVSVCACTLDCLGVINGSAQYDLCGVCNGANECLDCSGTPFGGQVIDLCGVCGGDNSTCADCAGTPNGTARLDVCGVCGGDNTSCADCAGVPNGTLTLDQCGVCGGNNLSCADCAGIPNGTTTIDSCGVCGGDNQCLTDQCVELKLSTNVEAFVHGVASQERQIKQLTAALRRSECAESPYVKGLIRKAKRTLRQGRELSDQVALNIPFSIKSCPGSLSCKSVDVSSTLKSASVGADDLYSISRKLVKARLSCLPSNKQCEGSVASCQFRSRQRRRQANADINLAKGLRQAIELQLNAIPAVSQNCQ